MRTEYRPRRLNGDGNRPPAPKTLRNIWVTFGAFFTWASRELGVARPLQGVPALRLLVTRLGSKAKVPKNHPHRFRHTFAITYLRSSVDVFTLQALLGHTTLDMEQHYARIAQVDIEQAHRRTTGGCNAGHLYRGVVARTPYATTVSWLPRKEQALYDRASSLRTRPCSVKSDPVRPQAE